MAMRWRQVLTREAIFLVVLLLSVLFVQRTVSAFEVDGASMEPTLHSREYVVVDRLALTLRAPVRGDVIVFRYPRNTRIEYVKRIIGLPGETVAVSGGVVWINNLPLQEPYLQDRPRYRWGPGVVPEGNVFVLGDNRNSSSDSHLWGPVPFTHVVGWAWVAYRPFTHWSWLAGQSPVLAAAPG